MDNQAKLSAEVIVIGAGMAGSAAAAVLGQQGRRVILVDPWPTCPRVFKAEKIEPDQVQMLRKLGLFEQFQPYIRRIRETRVGYNGRLFEISPIEQYGIHYSEMVNIVRSNLPAGVEQKIGRVESVANGSDLQRVRLVGGEELTARLVVLACGVSNKLQASLGFRKNVICKDQSVSLGFSIALPDGSPFPFDAMTYYPTTCTEYIDFLSIFIMGDAMRANLFVFRSATDPWVRRFIAEPDEMLARTFPKLSRLIGECRVVSKVEAGPVSLYRMEGEFAPGVVLIGDTFQGPCPSTGMGLSKVLTDVDILTAECLPLWLATAGMGCEKIAGFYSHPRKRSMDDLALRTAQYRRRVVRDHSVRWYIHRLRLHAEMQFGRPSKPSLSSARSPVNELPRGAAL